MPGCNDGNWNKIQIQIYSKNAVSVGGDGGPVKHIIKKLALLEQDIAVSFFQVHGLILQFQGGVGPLENFFRSMQHCIRTRRNRSAYNNNNNNNNLYL